MKPNEDFLAIHNGTKKIGAIGFVNYLLNEGGSYSAYYLIQGMALSKFIKKKYKKLYVCGLSQGGFAALIISLQATPEKAMVASGFSVLLSKPHRSSHNQIILPNYGAFYDPDSVKSQIENTSTQFLFTWGMKESELYGRDIKERLAVKLFKGVANVQTYIHPKGHVYYEPAIVEFFEKRDRK